MESTDVFHLVCFLCKGAPLGSDGGGGRDSCIAWVVLGRLVIGDGSRDRRKPGNVKMVRRGCFRAAVTLA